MQRLTGIGVDCLVITSKELTQLLWENRTQFEEDFDNWSIENENDIDYEVLDEIWCSLPFASVLYVFNGSFWYRFDTFKEFKRYEDETLYIIELEKNTLYDKYENEEEIIQELKNGLADMGIVVDNEFVKEHFGFLEGTY